jgi:flagellar motor switch protein FliG
MSTLADSKTAGRGTPMSGPEKVAILLLALGKAKAAKLLKRFDADDLRLLARSVTDLRPVTASDLEGLVEEFGQRFSSGVNFVGTADEIRDLLADVMPAEESTPEPAAPEPQSEPGEPVWDKIGRMRIEMLRALLMQEHPQTVAFILSRLGPEAAAKAISSLPTDYRSDLLCRMLGIRKVPDQVIGVVEARLASALAVATPSGSRNGIADILNRLEKTQSDAVLQSLAAVRPEDAKALKGMLFSFEDLMLLPPPARTAVLDSVPIERLILALKGTDATFQAAVLSALGARSRRMVEAELQGGGAAAVRDVADARRVIADTALKMIAKGDIQIPAPDDLDDVTQ